MVRFKQVAVVGAGLMGQYIALTYAAAGSFVRVMDLDQDRLDQAVKRIQTTLANTAGSVPRWSDEASILGRISTCTDLGDGVGDADLILEAIIEKVDAKRDLFARIAGYCPQRAIITSNTSTLNVFELMPQNMLRRAAMTHFFVPPHIVPLVEVVVSPEADPDVMPALREYLMEADMRPVFMKRFIKGFIINRLQRAYNREAFQLVEDGFADAATIDAAVKASIAIRFPVMAIMEKNDQAGLDLVLNNSKASFDMTNANEPSRILERMVREGELGFKSGKGFYDYSHTDKEQLMKERDAKLLRVRRLLQELGEI